MPNRDDLTLDQLVNAVRDIKEVVRYHEFSGHYWCNLCGLDLGYRDLHPIHKYPMCPVFLALHHGNCPWVLVQLYHTQGLHRKGLTR